jgi:hypothetical protein
VRNYAIKRSDTEGAAPDIRHVALAVQQNDGFGLGFPRTQRMGEHLEGKTRTFSTYDFFGI